MWVVVLVVGFSTIHLFSAVEPGNVTHLKQLLTNSKYKFIFVREPMERLASCYLDKFVHNEAPILINYRRRVKTFINRQILNKTTTTPDESVSFEEFLQYILKRPDSAENFASHWIPYYKVCFPRQINYNFIGKLDSSMTDLQVFL